MKDELEVERKYYLSGKDKFFIWIITSAVSLIFIYSSFFGNEGFMGGSIAIWFFIWIIGSFIFSDVKIECSHPGLMRFTYVFAFVFGLAGLYSHNITLSNMAFFSVLLYPFLEWLDLSVKIPQNASSTLLFGMLQFLALYILSYVLEQLK